MFAEEIIAFADFIMAREHGLLLYPDACTDLNHNVYYHTGHLVSDTGLVSVFFIYTFCTNFFALSLSRSMQVCVSISQSLSLPHTFGVLCVWVPVLFKLLSLHCHLFLHSILSTLGSFLMRSHSSLICRYNGVSPKSAHFYEHIQ